MHVTLKIAAALGLAATLAGCYSPGERAMGGAALGGASGAILGAALSGGRAGPTVAGAAVGAATGAMVGASTAQPRYYGDGYGYGGGCARWGYDYYGNAVCLRPY